MGQQETDDYGTEEREIQNIMDGLNNRVDYKPY